MFKFRAILNISKRLYDDKITSWIFGLPAHQPDASVVWGDDGMGRSYHSGKEPPPIGYPTEHPTVETARPEVLGLLGGVVKLVALFYQAIDIFGG
jgi:hypothetical protein